jgi:hypothetical protein
MGPINSQQGTKVFPIWTAYLEFLELNFEVEGFLEFWYSECFVASTISLTSEWHFVKTFFFKIGLETNLE